MSGYKRAMIRISQEEYRRLHQADMQTRFASSRQRNQPTAYQTDLTDYKRLAKLEQQQSQFNGLIDQISGEIGAIESNTHYEMINQQGEFQNAVSAHLDEIWQNEQNLGQILAAFEQHAVQESLFHKTHVEKTNEFINAQIETDLSRRELAEEWFSRSRSMGLFIKNNYDHDRFAPGQYEKIVRELNLAQRNINQGIYESAISSAQNAYLHLSDLRLDLDQRVYDWQTLFDTTWQAAKSLYDMVRDNSSCNALDLEGQELPICLELDFWSKGQYSTLEKKLRDITVYLTTERSYITLTQLNDLLTVDLPQLKNEFDGIVYRVRYCAINSQLRVNIADMAVHALGQQGFISDKNGYLDNDQRNHYITQLVNIDGSRITIQIDPIDDLETTNDIVMITEDVTPKFQPEVRKRANMILQSLQKWGLHVGQIQTSPRNSESQIEPDQFDKFSVTELELQNDQRIEKEYGRAN